MASDGYVIIDSRINTEGIEKGAKNMGSQFGDLGKLALKLGGAIAAAFSIDAIIDFSKQAIELGSDLQEVQNVVDVTFSTMNDSVNQFAKDAQKTAGLSEKMAKQYVGTFGAMADSFGFTEAEAYEMSTALTQLTGDVASFYNLSQDEAATKLKGVFTGETEALKELGVVMTQTALDSYALANGFGKTTDAMTEQEKVSLRYQFVMDQLSAASGDFVRTQDSWANQSKVLALQFESLMATIGTGLISVLTPAVQFINDNVVPVLQDAAEGFAELFKPRASDELERSLKQLDSAMEDINETFSETSREIETNAEMAKICVKRLGELEEAGLDTAEAQAEYANNVRYLNELYPELNLQIDENTGLTNMSREAILGEIDAMSQKALYIAMQDQYTEKLQAQAEAALAVKNAEYELVGVTTQLQNVESQLTTATGMTADELIQLYYNQLMVNLAMENNPNAAAGVTAGLAAMGEATNVLTSEQMKEVELLIQLQTEEGRLNGLIEDGSDSVNQMGDDLKDWAKAMGLTTDEQGDLLTSTEETADSVNNLSEAYQDAAEAARQSIDSQIGYFDKLETESDMSASEIIANWEAQKQAIDNYNDNLQKAVDMGLAPELVQQLSDGSKESILYLDQLVNTADLGVEEINAAFDSMIESRDSLAETMKAVNDEMASQLSTMSSTVETELNGMVGTFETKIGLMQGYIDSLTGKIVYIDVVQRGSTNSSGLDGKTMSTWDPEPVSAYAITPQVPYLASGAVIPPNAPFYAVLGDQRHGTNIEAPLSTIQEAVRAELDAQMGGMMAGFEAVVNATERLTAVVEGIEVGDTTIGEAAARYSGRMAIIHGGAQT